MKKTLCLMVMLLCFLLVSAQQNVILKFTARTSDGSYHPFDYVSVTNVTRGWNELLSYPDTTMTLTSYDGTQEGLEYEEVLSDPLPNPCYGQTILLFNIEHGDAVNVRLFSSSGAVLLEYCDYLETGFYQIKINIEKPQMAFCVINTSRKQYVKKILSIGSGNGNNIIINRTNEVPTDRNVEGGVFVVGDLMSYKAISIENGNSFESNTITNQQYHSETISLLFSTPIVTTSNVVDITTNSAVSGGLVTSDGGSFVTARGVCWSTSPHPTISNSHTTDGNGTGSFTSNILGLIEGTVYYVRAYATNGKGTAYGEQKSFTTPTQTLPTVTTQPVSSITTHSAVCGGTVLSDGNSPVTSRGVCWSTLQNPTIYSNHTTDGSGTGVFSSNLSDLLQNTTYYVRAYATNEVGTAYGSQVSFTTELFPTGAINGLFSVSATQQVYFSQGNLQYQASTNTWRFAENQWEYVGEDNSNISSSYDGWIDLFGWGTSGYNHGATCYQPWSTSTVNSFYNAYGNILFNLFDQTGMADWGYNPISNGGNTENQWRTLTKEEWEYVFNTRNTSSGVRYAKAIVAWTKGVIILPDNWSTSYYSLSYINNYAANCSHNTISVSTWINNFEANGAVFLPCADARENTTIFCDNCIGEYWSATKVAGEYEVYILLFQDGHLSPVSTTDPHFGLSVRLVQNNSNNNN
ncbi:MAG: hypothetical protein K5920_02315 [Bacteroidales bacterium]|nr:hypothetical protein [Bacteroidales bacterium]